MDERFIYLDDNVAVRVSEIKAVTRNINPDGTPGDILCVFTGNGENDYFQFRSENFYKVFGREYTIENIRKHLLELFLNELNEGIVNRPKYKAVKPVLVQKADNSVVKECPVCGKAVSGRDYSGGIHACGQCGVMLDYDK